MEMQVQRWWPGTQWRERESEWVHYVVRRTGYSRRRANSLRCKIIFVKGPKGNLCV